MSVVESERTDAVVLVVVDRRRLDRRCVANVVELDTGVEWRNLSVGGRIHTQREGKWCGRQNDAQPDAADPVAGVGGFAHDYIVLDSAFTQ